MWNTRNAHVQSRAEHHNSYLNFSRVKSLSPRVGHRDITRFQSYQKEKEKFLYNQHAVTSITHFSFMIIHVLMCCLSIKMNLIIAINVDNKNYFLDDRVGISVIILSIFFFWKRSQMREQVKFLVLNFYIFVCLMRMRNIFEFYFFIT